MGWIGEPTIPKAFGFPGYKAIIACFLERTNRLRREQGLPEETLADILTEIEAKIEEFKDDVTPD